MVVTPLIVVTPPDIAATLQLLTDWVIWLSGCRLVPGPNITLSKFSRWSCYNPPANYKVLANGLMRETLGYIIDDQLITLSYSRCLSLPLFLFVDWLTQEYGLANRSFQHGSIGRPAHRRSWPMGWIWWIGQPTDQWVDLLANRSIFTAHSSRTKNCWPTCQEPFSPVLRLHPHFWVLQLLSVWSVDRPDRLEALSRSVYGLFDFSRSVC